MRSFQIFRRKRHQMATIIKQLALLAIIITATYILLVWNNQFQGKITVMEWKERASFPDDLYESLEYSTPESFDGFDNETGVDHFIIPNIVHFIRFNISNMPFYEYLCILAAHKAQNPSYIFIHTNTLDMEGYYWNKLKEKLGDVLQVRYKELPANINGRRGPFHIFHFSDVARIQVLITYGGIYLDSDLLLLKSLDPFRKYEMTAGWDRNQFLATQIIVAHKNTRFLRKWLESYEHYDPSQWYYNAGELPTTKILIPQPELVHRVIEYFGVRRMAHELYNVVWEGWKFGYFSIHLLMRHRIYLNIQDIKETGIYDNFTEESVKGYDRTFGQLARLVLYNTTEMLAASIRKKL